MADFDILVNNAGVVKAGALDELTLSQFEFVTRVNYNAYFLCAKYAAEIMKAQRQFSDELFDIIQINSKSGLEGSKRNFAYSGSKFGGIGLTQSFAKELAEYGIKVNACVPGQLPGRAAVVRSGKGPVRAVPKRRQGARRADRRGRAPLLRVQGAAESGLPAAGRGRGAIFYCVEQKYETGQAIPVTGGQNMLA